MDVAREDSGVARRALIRTVSPAADCVLRASPDPARRRLTLRGEGFPTANHGLQFRRLADDDLSIIFDMEVEWLGAGAATLDLARVRDLLWPDRVVRLAARLLDTTDANYRPLSDWSAPFTLADDAAACGMAEVEPAGVRELPRVSDRSWADLLRRLVPLGLFDYAAPSIRAELEGVADTIVSYMDFCVALEEYPTLRSWSADGEDLAEGGVVAWLARLRPFFATQGLAPAASQVLEPSGQEYVVTVDGRPVTIYTAASFPELGAWATAAIRAVAIVDDLLVASGSPERAYVPAVDFGGNGGRLLLLTPPLAEAINASILLPRDDRLLTAREITAWL